MSDTPPTNGEPKRRISWTKRILFLLILLALLTLFAECGLRVVRKVIRPAPQEQGAADPCEAVVFVCVGDSMTFGLGAEKPASYPGQISRFFSQRYPKIPVKAYNLGISGSNTSEGISQVRTFFARHKHKFADYALILYGVNNRWNLHNATFWEWDKDARQKNYGDFLASKLQLNKVFQVAVRNRSEQLRLAQRTHGETYRGMLDDKGWDVFFSGFDDELLSEWIDHDLGRIEQLFRTNGAEPIFLTYHYPRFPHLNELIRRIAKKRGVALIDLEKPIKFYSTQKMLDEDNFHLNAKGYQSLARRIIRDFGKNHSRDQVAERLEEKLASGRCKTKKPPARKKASKP